MNGDFADYLFDRFGTYAVSVEVGGSGFWVKENEIKPLAEENLQMILYASQAAGPLLTIREITFAHEDPEEKCISFKVANEGTWNSFGHNIDIKAGLYDGNEETKAYLSVQSKVVRKILAFGETSTTMLCFHESLVTPTSSVKVMVADKAHCVVYKLNFSKQSDRVDFSANALEGIRADPGFGECDLLPELAEPYFDRLTKEELKQLPHEPIVHKKVKKIWEHAYDTDLIATESTKNLPLNSASEESSGSFQFLGKSFKLLVGVGSAVFILTFLGVFMVLVNRARKEEKTRGKYEEMDEDGFEFGGYEGPAYDSDLDTEL